MQKALERRKMERRMMIDLARAYVDQIMTRKAEPVKVLARAVIGSVARADFNQASDIDMIIISDNLPDNPLARSELLYRDIPPKIEPKAFTPAEFRQMVEKKNPLAVSALTYGVVLCDTDGLFERGKSPLGQD